MIVDLDECLASVREIAAAYERLKELCMPSSEEELKTQDPTWFSSVQNTMWLQVRTICVRVYMRAFVHACGFFNGRGRGLLISYGHILFCTVFLDACVFFVFAFSLVGEGGLKVVDFL